MPLTAVGKIFKPALKHHETDRVLETVLSPFVRAGAVEIKTSANPKTGQHTIIRNVNNALSESQIREIEEKLSPYPISWSIETA